MGESIECGGREQRTLKKIGPFRERAIRRDDHRAALVPFIDDIVRNPRLMRRAGAKWLFADTSGVNQETGALLDEAAGGKIKDLLTIERWVEPKIEALERLRLIERGASEPKVQLLLAASLDLVFDQTPEEIAVGELLGNGLLHPDLERLENPGCRRLSFGVSC